MVFVVLMGNYMSSSVLGHADEYQVNCDESFNIPRLQFIEPRDQSYYFENPDATCDKLLFLVYFMTGLTIFVIGSGVFTLSSFIMTCEVSIVVRKRY